MLCVTRRRDLLRLGRLAGAVSPNRDARFSTSIVKSCHVGTGNLSLACRAGSQLGDEEELLQLESGGDHLLAERGQKVFVGAADSLD